MQAGQGGGTQEDSLADISRFLGGYDPLLRQAQTAPHVSLWLDNLVSSRQQNPAPSGHLPRPSSVVIPSYMRTPLFSQLGGTRTVVSNTNPRSSTQAHPVSQTRPQATSEANPGLGLQEQQWGENLEGAEQEMEGLELAVYL